MPKPYHYTGVLNDQVKRLLTMYLLLPCRGMHFPLLSDSAGQMHQASLNIHV